MNNINIELNKIDELIKQEIMNFIGKEYKNNEEYMKQQIIKILYNVYNPTSIVVKQDGLLTQWWDKKHNIKNYTFMLLYRNKYNEITTKIVTI